jgi:hypothetical protein
MALNMAKADADAVRQCESPCVPLHSPPSISATQALWPSTTKTDLQATMKHVLKGRPKVKRSTCSCSAGQNTQMGMLAADVISWADVRGSACCKTGVCLIRLLS